MPKVMLALQVIPLIDEGYSDNAIDSVITIIQASGLKYEVGPMEIIIIGKLDELWLIVKKAQEMCIEKGAYRVFTKLKIDYVPQLVHIS